MSTRDLPWWAWSVDEHFNRAKEHATLAEAGVDATDAAGASSAPNAAEMLPVWVAKAQVHATLAQVHVAAAQVLVTSAQTDALATKRYS